MYVLIKRWQSSGVSQKAFCKEEDINYYKFKYWRTQLKKAPVTRQPRNKPKLQEQNFIPIQTIKEKVTFEGLLITYPNGVSITCSGQTKTEQLTELIKLY